MLKSSSAILFTVILLMAVSSARCELNCTIRSSTPSLVFIDGEYRGETPVMLHSMAPGAYELLVENKLNGNYRVFALTSYDGEITDHTFTVNFYGPSNVYERVITSREFTVEPYIEGRRTVPAMYHPRSPQVVYVYPVQPAPVERNRGTSQGNVRTRNTVLGVGVLNEVFNGGGSRKGVRKGVIGGAFLNEVLRK